MCFYTIRQSREANNLSIRLRMKKSIQEVPIYES